ncbi:hypothetical protein D3C87_1959110 [compost metagenome]
MQFIDIPELGQTVNGGECIVEKMGVDLCLQGFQLRFFLLKIGHIIFMNQLFHIAAHPVEGDGNLRQLVIAFETDSFVEIPVVKSIQRPHDLLNPPGEITGHPDAQNS